MADEIVLRPLRWPDLVQAQAIEQESFPVDQWSAETFWSELAGVPDRRRYLAAVTSTGELAGYAGLALATPDCDIQTVVVAPLHRGRGVGESLLAELLAVARNSGCTRCHLEVRSDNQAALRLYERHGFTPISNREGYYDEKAGALVMTAELADPGESAAGSDSLQAGR